MERLLEPKLFTLRDLLQEQVRDLYDAEMQYAGMLPLMMGRATATDLKVRLAAILGAVDQAISDLIHVCDLLSIQSEGVRCEAMRGLVREAKDTTAQWGDTATVDAALISNAQRIVHYEIAGFGTAREFARCLKLSDVAEILDGLLEKAAASDKALTRIAIGGWLTPGINQEAAQRDAA